MRVGMRSACASPRQRAAQRCARSAFRRPASPHGEAHASSRRATSPDTLRAQMPRAPIEPGFLPTASAWTSAPRDHGPHTDECLTDLECGTPNQHHQSGNHHRPRNQRAARRDVVLWRWQISERRSSRFTPLSRRRAVSTPYRDRGDLRRSSPDRLYQYPIDNRLHSRSAIFSNPTTCDNVIDHRGKSISTEIASHRAG